MRKPSHRVHHWFPRQPEEITISQFQNVMPMKATADAVITRCIPVSWIASFTKSTVPRMRGISLTPLTCGQRMDVRNIVLP